MTAQNAQAGTDAQSQAGIHTYTLPQPIRQQGSHQIVVSALWRRRGSNAFTMFLGAFGILVLLSFIITGIGGIQYRFEQMLVTNHGDDPHLVVTFTDVVIILICVVVIVIPTLILIFSAWSLGSDILHGGARRRFVRDPHTLGVRTDQFAPGIEIVRQPDRDDGDDDSTGYPIPRILFRSGSPSTEFRMLAYISESLWREAGAVMTHDLPGTIVITWHGSPCTLAAALSPSPQSNRFRCNPYSKRSRPANPIAQSSTMAQRPAPNSTIPTTSSSTPHGSAMRRRTLRSSPPHSPRTRSSIPRSTVPQNQRLHSPRMHSSIPRKPKDTQTR